MTHMPQHFATSDFKTLRRARCFKVFTTLYCNKKKTREKKHFGRPCFSANKHSCPSAVLQHVTFWVVRLLRLHSDLREVKTEGEKSTFHPLSRLGRATLASYKLT